ncbi:hypothetical protein ACO22_03575, partial [Paracoccidioides brasiliensis]
MARSCGGPQRENELWKLVRPVAGDNSRDLRLGEERRDHLIYLAALIEVTVESLLSEDNPCDSLARLDRVGLSDPKAHGAPVTMTVVGRLRRRASTINLQNLHRSARRIGHETQHESQKGRQGK